MKKGQKPSIHTRKVRTKRGRKSVTINPHIKKAVKIKKGYRKIFTHLSDPKHHSIEYGGGLDFGKKKNLEKIRVMPGSKYSIDLPDDFEVLYHTHPDKKPSPPTSDDLIALIKNNKQRVEIVFRKGKAFIITKTPITKQLAKLPTYKLQAMIDERYALTMGKNWEKNYKKELEKLGFIVQVDDNIKKPLKFKVRIVEPGRGGKR